MTCEGGRRSAAEQRGYTHRDALLTTHARVAVPMSCPRGDPGLLTVRPDRWCTARLRFPKGCGVAGLCPLQAGGGAPGSGARLSSPTGGCTPRPHVAPLDHDRHECHADVVRRCAHRCRQKPDEPTSALASPSPPGPRSRHDGPLALDRVGTRCATVSRSASTEETRPSPVGARLRRRRKRPLHGMRPGRAGGRAPTGSGAASRFRRGRQP